VVCLTHTYATLTAVYSTNSKCHCWLRSCSTAMLMRMACCNLRRFALIVACSPMLQQRISTATVLRCHAHTACDCLRTVCNATLQAQQYRQNRGKVLEATEQQERCTALPSCASRGSLHVRWALLLSHGLTGSTTANVSLCSNSSICTITVYDC
jgi:hypothetical protein